MARDWGANIGKVLREYYGEDVKVRARYMAAAGSDARMSGCEMPVIIVSGSGNQGITASVPVAVYAQELKVSHEKLLRAVVLSDLLAIHMKTGIGRLSAYCGAVSAGCAAGAAISHLYGGGRREVEHTLVNALATISGMICDGAKPSCAAKIAAAVDAGTPEFKGLYQIVHHAPGQELLYDIRVRGGSDHNHRRRFAHGVELVNEFVPIHKRGVIVKDNEICGAVF